MMYESILQRIEDEKKDEVISAKLYRYTGLVQAIDFFSQKLVFEQIIDAAFDFINELLLVDNSVIFVYEDGSYNVKKVKGFTNQFAGIPLTKELGNLATLNGSIIYGRDKITRFLKEEFIDSININSMVPLIIEGNLYGIILFNDKNIGEDDYIISEALMRLINNALENFSRYEKLAKVNSELDEKIFNLFAINQSSKILLSELNLDVLYSISVDVFSELTRSKITGFILFDERSENFTLKSYKDVFYKIGKLNIDLNLNKSVKPNQNKVIIDLSKATDCEYIDSLFSGASSQLQQLETKYAVLILKNYELLGIVTLSETVTGSEYSASIFELIESLASSTYTAVSNARLFAIVNEQKALIQRKLDKLISLNNLTKNISSSTRIDALLETCVKTLEISFNTEKGLFCLFKEEDKTFKVANSVNLEHCISKNIDPNPLWKRLFEGDTLFAMGQYNIAEFFGTELASDVGDAQGVLLIPVYIELLEIEMLGVIAIFKYNDLQLDNEENILILETIAGNIAPVLNNLLVMQRQQRFLLPNYIELFKKDLKNEVIQALELNLDLTVIQIMDEKDLLFRGNHSLEAIKASFKNVYPFSPNNIFVIENANEYELEEKLESCIRGKNLEVRKMKLGKDFSSFADFFKLYK